MCQRAKALRLMVLCAPIWRMTFLLSGYLWKPVTINRTSSWAEEIKKQSLNDNDHDHGKGDIGIPLRWGKNKANQAICDSAGILTEREDFRTTFTNVPAQWPWASHLVCLRVTFLVYIIFKLTSFQSEE